MKRSCFSPVVTTLIVILSAGFAPAGFAADATLSTPDGTPVVWSDWIAEQAPVAALLWASWVPGAEETLTDLGRIETSVRAQGLDLVLIAVQEPIGDAAEALEGHDVSWLHDRYGRLLKDYRVVDIPRLLVFADDGRVVERLEVNSESLRAWGGE